MVVMNRQPEETTGPFPVYVWVELGHCERGLESVAQVEDACCLRAEFPRRFDLHLLDAFGPTRPALDARQVLPRLLKWQIHHELSPKQSNHCPAIDGRPAARIHPLFPNEEKLAAERYLQQDEYILFSR
jgi:hypothetical protein